MPNQSCRRRGDLPQQTPSESESMESLRGRINLAGLEPVDLEANRNAPRSLGSIGVFEEAWGWGGWRSDQEVECLSPG